MRSALRLAASSARPLRSRCACPASVVSKPAVVLVFPIAAGHESSLCGPGEAMALITDAPLEHEHRFALDDARGVAHFLAARLDTLRKY